MKKITQSTLAIALVLSGALLINSASHLCINQVVAAEITCTGGHPHICYEEFRPDGTLLARVYGNKAVIVTGEG